MKSAFYSIIVAFLMVAVSYGQSGDFAMKPLTHGVVAGRKVSFELESKGSGETDFQWEFGDEGSASGEKVAYTFKNVGIFPVWLSAKANTESRKLAAIIRVHDPNVASVPQVFLDTDARCEADDQHFISYALFSELDVLGISSVHNSPGTEEINYGEILYVYRLALRSGLTKNRIPMAFHGADEKLQIPKSGKWTDTKPILTDAVDAILATARGASPDDPVWVLPVGAGTNIASAILQAQREGFDLSKRIRLIWLGGHANDYHREHNGAKDPWSVYVMGQSGIDLQILLSHPTSLKLNIDKRVESGLYPDNELGKYLNKITPVFQWRSTRPKSLHDVSVLATVISDHLGLDWVTELEPTQVAGPGKEYSWQKPDAPTKVRLIRDIDGEAMKADLFNTLNGKPISLRPKK